MLKAVRRTRSHRPLVDAVSGGPGPPSSFHAGEKKEGKVVQQIEEPPPLHQQREQQGGENENDSSSEGAHGPTAPYYPNAVIPAAAAPLVTGGDSVSGPDHTAIIPSKHGQGHVADAQQGAPPPPPPVQNVDIPPVRFPDGRNPYLDRPLPLPPAPKLPTTSSNSIVPTTTTAPVVVVAVVDAAVPAPLKITRPIMPARPSTSSGPDSSSSSIRMATSGLLLLNSKNSFDRRLSKDDMALEVTTQMGMVRTSKGLQPYRIGIKGGGVGGALPTPEASPSALSLISASSSSSSSPNISGQGGYLPARVMTPESLSSGEIQIGMALGSPSHASFIAGWEAQQQQPQQAQQQMQPALQTQPPQGVYSPPLIQEPQLVLPPQPHREPTPEPPATSAAPIQRQKTQKRRLFGLFSRKNVEPPKAADVIEANNSSLSLASNSSQSQSQQGWQVDNKAVLPARSNTVAGGGGGGKKSTHKFRPLLSRSGTESDMGVSVVPPQQQQTAAAAAAAAPQLSSGPGLLDIEIPDIRLERYSIMFSGVLNQGGGVMNNGGGGPASSLLARRQATLEKLKTINDKIQDEEDEKLRNKYRRATSPQPMNSPVFTLFPTTTPRQQPQQQPQQPRPSTLAPMTRMRSNTSPALLPSPSKGTFDESNLLPINNNIANKKEKKTVTIISPRTMDERTRAAQVEKLREQQQQQQQQQQAFTGFRFGPEESALILDSPSSLTSSSSSSSSFNGDNNNGEPFSPLSSEEDGGGFFQQQQPVSVILPPLKKPILDEPQWEMISTPPTITSTSISTTSSESSSSSPGVGGGGSQLPAAVVITRKKSRPSVSTATTTVDNNEEEEDADLKAAVEISIARQISISRQQRQMLLKPVKPVQRSNTIATNNGNHHRRLPPSVMVVDTTGTGTNGKQQQQQKKPITRSMSSPNREIASIVASKAAIKENGRVVETRLVVPKLVEVGAELGSSPSAAGNRKSERVVLVQGEEVVG